MNLLNPIKKHKIISIIVLLLAISIIVFLAYPKPAPKPKSSSHHTSTTSHKSQSKYQPLTAEQKKKVEQAILSSEFINSIPSSYPISLKFFYFENGSRIWQDKFIIGKGEILKSGSPGISLTLHSKYIEKLSDMDLCTLIKTAKSNGDLGFYSKYSDASLMWKYRTLLKYRDCFGL